MDYLEMLNIARDKVGPLCKACPVCNGKACGNSMPAPALKSRQRRAQKLRGLAEYLC